VRRVPLARRNFFQDRRRAGLSIGGVAVALLLVLVLEAVFAGAILQVTAYLRHLPAQAIISQRGVKTMHMSSSALPPDTVSEARRVRGVAWAQRIGFTTGTVSSEGGRQLSYVIGYDTHTGRGGPWEMVRGQRPAASEVVLDEVAASRLGVGVGARIQVLGRAFAISGLSAGGSSITNTVTFMRLDDFAAIRGDTINYVLVGTRPGVSPETITRRLAPAVPGATVQTREQFVREEGRIVRDMTADVMQIMSLIGFLIALAVVALTLFTATLAKLREYAVIKALGAGPWSLGRTVITQAVLATALALASALVLTYAIAAALAAATPNIRLAVEAGTVTRVAAAALLAGLAGALAPLRCLARLDPATAFRSS
jgi:putative ABC transport system permease protein